jgi:hypothetical protein
MSVKSRVQQEIRLTIAAIGEQRKIVNEATTIYARHAEFVGREKMFSEMAGGIPGYIHNDAKRVAEAVDKYNELKRKLALLDYLMRED